jgi:hypothetical protein
VAAVRDPSVIPELQGNRQVDFQRPIAVQIVEVVFAVLQIDLDRQVVFRLNEPRIRPAANVRKLPMWLSTFPNCSGFSQATVKAQMPPDEIPQTARSCGSFETFSPLSATGRNSSTRKLA